MISNFYKKYSVHLLVLVAISLPYLVIEAESLPANNDIETWLPRESEVRQTYEQFKSDFGAEELILIGLDTKLVDQQLIESVCKRIDRLPTIRRCWSPDRLRSLMLELNVPSEEVKTRLSGLAIGKQGTLIGLMASLSDEGLADRTEVVSQVKEQLGYCQLVGESVYLAGGPVVVAELNRLGGQENNKKFFIITLVISLVLLYYSVRQWKLTFAILGITIWSINLTLAILHMTGGEMNFIMGALSVMVMVFTLAVTIHFLHYYSASVDAEDPMGTAFHLALKPSVLATITTTIGLVSLSLSDISPVSDFGFAAAIGSIVALITGLGLTPAILTIWPYKKLHLEQSNDWFQVASQWIFKRSRSVALVTSAFVILAGIGITRIETRIDPLDFLPKDSKVLTDVIHIEKNLTNSNSIEAVVDLGQHDVPFLEKLNIVRDLETRIRNHPSVTHTFSLASFFPEKFSQGAFSTARLLSRARSMKGQTEFLSDGERLWRISARISDLTADDQQQTFTELSQLLKDEPVTFTGIAPLLGQAQAQIFDGFWKSFTTAFLIISLVMIGSLKSLKAGIVAMVPNLTPIFIVFGGLGWLAIPVDIGMMMTASIALGIAVDGTFHFLVRYQESFNSLGNSTLAAKEALQHTSAPIFKATTITGIGMLALTLSSFAPTTRFGALMTLLLLAALIGDLVLLPSLLALRPEPEFDEISTIPATQSRMQNNIEHPSISIAK